jgi:hypothetical protein
MMSSNITKLYEGRPLDTGHEHTRFAIIPAHELETNRDASRVQAPA